MSTKITNNTGISLPIAVWLAIDEYDYSDQENLISATTLIKPVKQIVLGRRYKEADKEMDVADLLAVKMGTAFHNDIENAWKLKDKCIEALTAFGYKNPEAIYDKITFEKRSSKEFGRYEVSGKFDLVFDGIVADIKSTSTWTYIFGSNDDAYIKQLSIYRVLHPDLIVNDAGYIEFIFTDWSAVKAKQDSQYPQQRVATKKMELMSVTDTEKWITDKLALVEKTEKLPDNKLPDCTDEELWKKEDKWKYYGIKGAKRAIKVFNTQADAELMLSVKGKGEVKKFAGGVKRCKYCSYINFCDQYSRLQMQGLIND